MNDQLFDVSSALPWLLIGAFAATVLWTLLHWLFGSKRRMAGEINALNRQLVVARSDLAASAGANAKLQSDSEHWQTALAEASKRTALISSVSSQQDTFKTQLNESISIRTKLQNDIQQIQAALADASQRAASASAAAHASAAKLAQAQSQIDAQAQELSQAKAKVQALISAPPPAPTPGPAQPAAAAKPAASINPEAAKTGELALATLRRDLDTRFIQIKNLEEDLARLNGENSYLKKEKAVGCEEIAKLKSELAGASKSAAETEQLRIDLEAAIAHRDALASEFETRAKVTLAQHDEIQRLSSGHGAPAHAAHAGSGPTTADVEKLHGEVKVLKSALEAKTRQAIEEAEARSKLAAAQAPELEKHQAEIKRLTSALEAKTRQTIENTEAMHRLKDEHQSSLSALDDKHPAVAMPANTYAPQPAGAIDQRTDRNNLRSVKSEALRTADFDDLKRIQGIGVLLEKRLNALGVVSYEQIANWSASDVEEVSNIFDIKGRVEREQWVEQARILANGAQTKFSSRLPGEA